MSTCAPAYLYMQVYRHRSPDEVKDVVQGQQDHQGHGGAVVHGHPHIHSHTIHTG